MNKVRPLVFIAILVTLFSCAKEYSEENLGAGNELIVGADCRISKIVYRDTSGMAGGGPGVGLGSIEAKINNFDIVTPHITQFDSIGNFIIDRPAPVYSNDSVFISADEYYIVDVNKRIIKSHLVVDITNPASSQFDVFYVYNTSGYLIQKNYFSTTPPVGPFLRVDYTYTSPGNLTRMTAVDLPGGDLSMDADITYYSNVVARRFIYTFPDEMYYPSVTQFFNFGARNFNVPKTMKVRNYDPGNIVRDSAVSAFSNYIISRDGYVLSVQMGNPQPEATPPLTPSPQPSIPALPGKLSFSYHCR
jgi:hypothetical protein